MKCQTCAQEIYMPFQCPYCGGQFCSAHRLPENHKCPRIDLAHSQKQEAVSEVFSPKTSSYQFSYSYNQQLKPKGVFYFSPKELRHIAVATLLVVGIGFSMVIYNNFFGGFYPQWTVVMMTVFAVLMTASFLVHEIAHKVTAQKAGLWAEFRLTMWGALLTLASVFLPFKMIAPGAMMIAGSPNKKETLKISVAGPITNLIFVGVFLVLAYIFGFSSSYRVVFVFLAYINAFLALFNLIPFGVLDGYKIFSINKAVWAATFIPSVILMITTWMLVPIH